MKIDTIVVPNQKGQVVIPKRTRETLGINTSTPLKLVVRGKGLYLYPIEEVILKTEKEDHYQDILNLTRGAWVSEDWGSLRKKRKKIEIAASKKRKQSW